MKRLFGFLLAAAFSISTFGATLVPVQLLNPSGSSSGQAIVSTGSSTAPAWGGVGVNGIAAIPANTVLANVTVSSASPTAFAMPNCSTASSILQYTSGAGFTCNTTIWASPPAIGGTAANAGAFTTLSASGTVSGAGMTNMVNAVLQSPGPIGSVTPATGKFTTIQATSTISPSTTAGIVGTTLGDNANGGSVGEYVSASASGTSLTTATPANCASASLTAGDWNVWGVVTYVPAASTTVSGIASGISTTSATLGGTGTLTSLNATLTTGAQQAEATPLVRVSLSSTTVVYLVGFAAFGTSTMTCAGNINARRVR